MQTTSLGECLGPTDPFFYSALHEKETGQYLGTRDSLHVHGDLVYRERKGGGAQFSVPRAGEWQNILSIYGYWVSGSVGRYQGKERAQPRRRIGMASTVHCYKP